MNINDDDLFQQLKKKFESRKQIFNKIINSVIKEAKPNLKSTKVNLPKINLKTSDSIPITVTQYREKKIKFNTRNVLSPFKKLEDKYLYKDFIIKKNKPVPTIENVYVKSLSTSAVFIRTDRRSKSVNDNKLCLDSQHNIYFRNIHRMKTYK